MANKMQSLIRLQCLLALSCAALLVVGTSHAEECAPLSAEVRARVARYAAEHYELAPGCPGRGGRNGVKLLFPKAYATGRSAKAEHRTVPLSRPPIPYGISLRHLDRPCYRAS